MIRLLFFLIISSLAFNSLGQTPVYDWSYSFGSTDNDNSRAIASDSDGNIYSTGKFSGTVDFDAGAGVSSLTSNGDSDLYILKMDSLGGFLWVKSIGNLNSDEGLDIICDASDNVVITGGFRDTLDFDPGAGVVELYASSNTFADAFLLKLSSSGNFIYALSYGGTGQDSGYFLGTDNNDNIYTTGVFQGTVDFDAGPAIDNLVSNGIYDCFVQKVDANGNLIWAKSFGGIETDVPLSSFINPDGIVYITGKYKDSVDFDPGPGFDWHNFNGGIDAFVLKLDSTGSFSWAKTFGGMGLDQGNSIVVDSNDDVIIVGQFQSSFDIDPGLGINIINAVGPYDSFILKLDDNGNYLWNKTIGTNSIELINAVDVGLSDAIYCLGIFYDTTDLDPGPGVSSFISQGNEDVFTLKLDATGNLEWAGQIGGLSYDNGYDIMTINQSLYISGYTSDTVDFDFGVGIAQYNSSGLADGYIAKYIENSNTEGIIPIDNKININIYPNPSNNIINVVFTNLNNDFNYKLCQVDGTVVDQKQDIQSNSFSINLNNRMSGIYLIYIETEGKTIVKRIVKR